MKVKKFRGDKIAQAMQVLIISSQKGHDIMFPKVGEASSTLRISPPSSSSSLRRIDFSIRNPKNSMVVSQGGWESDETIEMAACREAEEEAGVIGHIEVGSPPHSNHPSAIVCPKIIPQLGSYQSSR